MSDSTKMRAETAVAEFYAAAHKRTFLGKNAQKMECAESVSGKVPVADLLAATAFRAPGALPRIVFRYDVFKTFAGPSTYEAISHHVLTLIAAEIAATGGFEFHLDVATATVSALDRYRPFFEFFLAYCTANGIVISDRATAVVVYNTPSFIQTSMPLVQTFVDRRLVPLIEYVSKADSAERLAALEV
jgi:hypothetical protein